MQQEDGFDLTLARAKLYDFIKKVAQVDCALAFSGGVDSSLLLRLLSSACAQEHSRLIAIFAKTSLHTRDDLNSAREQCQQLLVPLIEMEVPDLQAIADNPPNRCYLCKRALLGALRTAAAEQGCEQLIDGTNADDLKSYRPGLQALQELSVLSPLALCGITKNQVRQLATELGVQAVQRPSSPCIATRFYYGAHLSKQEVERVAQAEQSLHALGYYNVRLRVHPGSLARLELDRCDLSRAVSMADELITIVQSAGYQYVTLDLQGFRSGSMDELLNPEQKQSYSRAIKFTAN